MTARTKKKGPYQLQIYLDAKLAARWKAWKKRYPHLKNEGLLMELLDLAEK